MPDSPDDKEAANNESVYPELTGLLAEPGSPAEAKAQVVAESSTSVKGDVTAFESTSWRGPFFQISAAAMASLSSVAIGFITGYSSLVLPQLVNDTSIDYDYQRDAHWIASLPSITSIFGSLVGGVIMEKIGPRTTLLVTAIPCILSWGFVAFAQTVLLMNVGRCLTGIFLGIYSPVPQVYATEIADPKYRGMMGAFPEAAVALGSMLCYIIGNSVDWRTLAILSALVPGVPLFLAMIPLPESPQWLTKMGKLQKAEQSVKRFRGPGYDALAEVTMIRKNIVQKDGADITIKEQLKLFRLPQNWKPILLVFLVFMCGQFSGFAVVVNYTVIIFDAANTGIDSVTSTMIVGSVRFLTTLLSAVLLDRVGRRPLLIISAIGSSLGMLSIGIFFYLQDTGADVENLGWLPLASLLLYVFFNELGYGPIPWLLSGELIPLAVRTLGNGVAVTAYSLFAFIISLTFPMMLKMFTTYTTFWLYATFSLSGVALTMFLPETKGKTLEEIEEFFEPKQEKRQHAL
uniref:Facilitated trehalose transporter Tret1-like n=1 Tax=Hirondellea gigas TaxID=1518452 RepID=A0A2P2I3T3_9CRUS